MPSKSAPRIGQVTTGVRHHLTQRSEGPRQVTGELGQLFRTEDEQRGRSENEDLAEADVEHLVLPLAVDAGRPTRSTIDGLSAPGCAECDGDRRLVPVAGVADLY